MNSKIQTIITLCKKKGILWKTLKVINFFSEIGFYMQQIAPWKRKKYFDI